MKFIGHLLRHNKFLTNIIEDMVLDKRGRGRVKNPFCEGIKHHIQIDKYKIGMKGAALDRREWLRLY